MVGGQKPGWAPAPIRVFALLQLIPRAETRSLPVGPGQDGELVAQQDVLDNEVAAAASRGAEDADQQDEQVEHAERMPDLPPASQPAPTSAALQLHRQWTEASEPTLTRQ